MDRLRALLQPSKATYEPTYIDEDARQEGEALMNEGEEGDLGASTYSTPGEQLNDEFSWVYYAVFMLLGVAMLWAW